MLGRMGRWWIVGLLATVAELGGIYLTHDRLGMALPIAAVAAGESVLLVRFLANDRWVFGQRGPIWMRLWQYHVASAAAFALHWAVLNGLAMLGLFYLLAALAATGVTVVWSMLSNFGWIWRHPSTSRR